MRFCGRYEHTLDGKGRFSVPARFRESLGEAGNGEVVVLCLYLGMERCVTIYGYEAWLDALEKIDNKPGISDDDRDSLIHLFRHEARLVPMDEQGRIVIPPEAREYASLKKEVVIVGEDRKLHVVNRELYRNVARGYRAGPDANPKMIRVVDR